MYYRVFNDKFTQIQMLFLQYYSEMHYDVLNMHNTTQNF